MSSSYPAYIELYESGELARRGVLVRHLVMPGHEAGTRQVMRFLAREISRDTVVNVMGQYRPEGQAAKHESINRCVTLDELSEASDAARQEGLHRFDRR